MKTPLIIDKVFFEVFKTHSSNGLEDFIADSRTYNNGLDFFDGCDISTAYVYLVNKRNTPKFIDAIEAFIAKAEGLNLSEDLDYLESTNDFAFLHKSFDASEYDLFITNFDMNMFQAESHEHLFPEHELFVQTIEGLSDFFVYTGAEFDDNSMFNFAITYLLKHQEDVVKEVYGFQFDTVKQYEFDSLEDFQMHINGSDPDMVRTFLKLYFSCIPEAIQDSQNIYGLVRTCLKQV